MLSPIYDKTPTKDTFLDIDNEIDDEKSIATIDTAHQFLNFSRKVTEASSMRKPVDIQLGIACGKDLLFNTSPHLFQQRRQKPSLSNTMNKKPVTLLHSEQKNNIITNSADQAASKKAVPSPSVSLNKKPSAKTLKTISQNKTNSGSSKEAKHRSLPLQSPNFFSSNNSDNSGVNKATTNSSVSSPLLDRLVADVLSHIESCPDRSAYSDDLDKLKPKLQAYSVTRFPSPLKSS